MPAQPAIIVETDDPEVTTQDGSDGVVVRLPDGAVVVDTAPQKEDREESDFDANLALEMSGMELGSIAESLLEGIEADLQSRKEWETIRAKGIDLLGLKLEEPRGDVGSSSAPLEGMATVRDTTLLEAVLRGQANAIGELLPAEGPVKIKNVGQGTTLADEIADQLEDDFNHWLVDVASEYYPDSKRMLFWTFFGGSGFKKVYSCPIRRRPVSESIDANDFIVSNAATDLWNAGRITHRISMRPSMMKRMQAAGIYREVELNPPSPTQNRVEEKKDSIEGVRPNQNRPEDQPYTVYECYCEWDLPEYAPKQFQGKGIPLPYRVTVEKDSRQILEVHRNWKEADESCLPRKFFVRYPYVEGLGIYGIGLVHILGNAAMALTGAEREMLDAGMYANFPAFLMVKQATRQLSNQYRLAPGSGAPIDAPTGKIGDAIMPLPYKDVTPGLMSLWQAIKEDAQRLGGTAEITIGEGNQEAPVGTTLALIEQATKVEGAVHKGMHHAQAEEFQLLKERFQEDPAAFWRHTPEKESKWTEETFLAGLEMAQLVPVADPNTPSHVHRIAKALAIKQLATASPGLYDIRAVDKRILAMIKVDDADSLFAPPAPATPDPKTIEANAKLLDAQSNAAKIQQDAQSKALEYQDNAKERESRENIETMKLAEALVVHSADASNADRQHVQAATDSAHSRLMDIHGVTNPPQQEPEPEGPPVQGARQAPDGHWYVKDPSPARKGKYLRVNKPKKPKAAKPDG